MGGRHPLRPFRGSRRTQGPPGSRQNEIKDLTGKGVIPVEHDLERMGDDVDDDTMDNARPFLIGKAAAVTNERKSAKAIVDEMVSGAVEWIQRSGSAVVGKP